MRRLVVWFKVGAVCAALAAPTAAQAAVDDERRICHIGRVADDAAPITDGDLSDACWQTAPAIGELVMVEPYEGRRPTQRTVVKLLHDRHNLFIAVWCFDGDPSTIRATQRSRDARLDPDDRIQFMFDPFENRRTGYFFQIGAGGSIGDGLSSANGSRFDKPWDTIFWGFSRLTPDGWQAELAIPFRSIPRKQGASGWGFNFKRFKRSAGEAYQWANPVQAVSFFRVSEMGTMRGIGAFAFERCPADLFKDAISTGGKCLPPCSQRRCFAL